MSSLGDRLHSAPFIRLLVPFISGIILAEWLLPGKNWIYFSAPLLFTFLLFYLRRCSYKYDPLAGLLVLLIFFSLGFSLGVNLRYVPEKLTGNRYYAVLDEFPVVKGKSYRSIIRLIQPEIKVLAYFEKSEEIKSAQPGTVLFFSGCPEIISNQGNPFEFDYKGYSLRNKIGHRLYLRNENYHILSVQKLLNLQERSLILREKLLNRLSQNGVKGETFRTISAITLGARDNLDPETTQSFARTGTIHVLAVSGGNVAVIFLLLNYLLQFLKKYRAGLILHALILTISIWGYALITGLSPSVLRAATMFTFIVIGNNLSRKPDIYNSLAASAFILMCLNPSLLYDVSFQLSYVAVIAIVVLQPILYKSFYLRYWIIDRAWFVLSVSIAAQIGTLPFSLYYFHQFPSYFWLSNLIVVPLVAVLLYLTFFVIAVIPIIPFLGTLMAQFLNWIGERMLEFLQVVEKLPFAVIENLYPSKGELALWTLLFILSALFLMYKKGIFVLMTLATVAILLLINNISLYNTLSRKEIVVFNSPGKTLVAFTTGRETMWLTSEESETFEGSNYYTKPYKGYRRITRDSEIYLSDTLSRGNGILTLRKNHINFSGLKISIINNERLRHDSFEGFPDTDIVLLTEKSVHIPYDFQLISRRTLFINTCMSKVLYNGASISDTLTNSTDIRKEPGAIKISLCTMPNDSNIRFQTGHFKN